MSNKIGSKAKIKLSDMICTRQTPKEMQKEMNMTKSVVQKIKKESNQRNLYNTES